MTEHEFSWETIDGTDIYAKYWSPESDVKGVICAVHGMGEHINRYDNFAAYFVEQGFSVIGFDHYGHGRSGGKRGHIPSYEHFMLTVDDLLAKAEEFFPETPQFLYGHSMGGNVILNYILNRKPQLAGVISSSAWLKLAIEPPAVKLALGKLMYHIYPAWSEATNLDATAISRDAEEVSKYVNDPLVHDKISTKLFIDTFNQAEWALDHADEFHLPLLIFHGTADALTSAEGSKEFAQRAKEDVTFKLYDGGYHELHNDLCRTEIYELIKQWLNERLS